jgi:ribosomal protein S18 acetylase RimI-like enzyme
MDDVVLRSARPDDAEAIAAVYLASFRSTYDFPLAHRDDEVRRWIGDVLLTTREVWVAAATEGAVVAMMALTSDMVDQLYVAPGWTGRGIGGRLIELAKNHRPDGLDLYTFEVNRGARRFYERHGFREVERGDGSGNDERQPDVRYAWRSRADGPQARSTSASALDTSDRRRPR